MLHFEVFIYFFIFFCKIFFQIQIIMFIPQNARIKEETFETKYNNYLLTEKLFI